MTTATGTSTTEMNCDVERPSERAALVAAEELDDEARHAVQEHVEPERPAGEVPPAALAQQQDGQDEQFRAGFVQLGRMQWTPSGVPT